MNALTSSRRTRGFNPYPSFAPRIWHGMSASKWAQLLWENRFIVHRMPMAAFISAFGVFNSIANRIQRHRHLDEALAQPLVADPIFVIGHWRTGTTYLHTLLSMDARFWAPTNYECFAPDHFMVTADCCPSLMQFPNKRPMDNMTMGWTEPQEDELALCVLGATSVYRNIAFPRRPNRHLESLTLEGVSQRELQIWKSALTRFVAYLNLAHQRQLILKSPTHTGRVRVLLDLFPNAKFVHITREPLEFIPSTIRLWKALDHTNGLQIPPPASDPTDYVFDCFHRMYDGFNNQRHLIPAENYYQADFQRLVDRPAQTISEIYTHLGLGEFSNIAEQIKSKQKREQDYERNRHVVTPQLAERIASECGGYVERYLQRNDGQSRSHTDAA